MQDHARSSLRRIVVRAALLLLAVTALAAATPWLLDQVSRLGGAHAWQRPDRPPTDQEIRVARRAEEKLAEAEKGWERSTEIAAGDAVVDPSGERVRWFQGFGISVESVPAGATVFVNGKERGETPLTTSVECAPGEPVQVEVRAAHVAPGRRMLRCRRNELIELTLELR